MKLLLPVLALAGAVSAQPLTPPPDTPEGQAPLDHVQQLGGWTVSDTGAKPGDDGERQLRLAKSVDGVDFVLFRGDNDGVGIVVKFARCDGFTVNSGFQLEGAIPARVSQVKDQVHDAFKDFAKRCPPKPGEEETLMAGFDPAERLLETWAKDRPFTYPPEAAEAKPK